MGSDDLGPVGEGPNGGFAGMIGGKSLMRLLSPRKIPAMSLHRGSGQAVVRIADHRENGVRGDPPDVYLGVHGKAGVREEYEKEIRGWIERALEVGWCPDGWEPSRTGHEGVLTVGQLVEGFGKYLKRTWGTGWQDLEMDMDQVREYRELLGQAWRLMREAQRKGDRAGRRGSPSGRKAVRAAWDREMSEEGKRLRREARRRYGHLDASLHRLLTARVLEDLLVAYGGVAAAAFGERELRRLRSKWTEQGLSLNDRKAGMKVVEGAFEHVIGRKPSAPWNKDRSELEREPRAFGLDLGFVGEDGRWVRTA